jgi:hypothetical protein
MSTATASYSTEVAGWKALVLENDLLRVTCLPGYGGWITSAVYKPRDCDVLYQAPRGVIRREDTPVVADPLYLYRSRSPGGWPEIFPHGSAPVKVGNVTQPFHGEAVNRAWRCEVLEARGASAAAALRLDCHLQPLRIERVMRLDAGKAALVLEETVTNYSGEATDFMWGHHPMFGKPIFSGGARLFIPAARSLTGDYEPAGWPEHAGQDLSLCPTEGAGTGEMFYADRLAAGWAALVNPQLKLGAALAWDPKVFPLVWIWRECGASKGYPYFGRNYCVAIEPFSNLPGARGRIEAGEKLPALDGAAERLLRLEGGERLSARLVLSAFEGLSEVTAVSPDGQASGR